MAKAKPATARPAPAKKKSAKAGERVSCYRALRDSDLYRQCVQVRRALKKAGMTRSAAAITSVLDEVRADLYLGTMMDLQDQMRVVAVMGMVVLADLGRPFWQAVYRKHMRRVKVAEARDAKRKAERIERAAAILGSQADGRKKKT